MNAKTLATAGAMLTVAALSFTACASPAGTDSDSGPTAETGSLEALIAAAKEEGSLSIYGELQEPDMVRFAEGFEAKYGIKAEPLRLGGNSLAQRFDAESSAGGSTADLLMGLDMEFFKDVIERDLVVSFEDSGVKPLLDGYPDEFSFTEFGVPLMQTVSTGYIFNTAMVDAAEVPKTWADLVTSERWAGEYCSVDPSTSFSVVQFFSVVRETGSDEVLEQFGKNIGRWYPNIVAMNEAIAVGECALGINSAEFFVEFMKSAGAPVDFAVGPTTIHPIVTAAVVEGAKHPNAARLFLHYVLSEEGNRLLNTPAAGSFGPWDADEMAADFWVPASDDFDAWRAEQPEIMKVLGL